MIGVEYRGNIGEQMREVSKGEYLGVNIPGNHVFWATEQSITSARDATNYSATSNQIIKIDGKEIEIAAVII
jgi:flagellar hook-associated protein 3 FlgL